MHFNFLIPDKDDKLNPINLLRKSDDVRFFLNELHTYLNNPKFHKEYENDLFQLDHIAENKWAIIVNLSNNKSFNIPISDLPDNAERANILKIENKKYVIDFEKR